MHVEGKSSLRVFRNSFHCWWAACTTQRNVPLRRARCTTLEIHTKSKNILAASKILIEKFGSCEPRTHGALMALPRVGRKSADIVMRFVWGEPHIAVDTHVFRLLRRLGWLRSLDEGKASIEVNAISLDEFKHGAHMWQITHAKAVCRSHKPLCDSCILRDQCERRDVEIPKNKLRALYRGDYHQKNSTARSSIWARKGGESGLWTLETRRSKAGRLHRRMLSAVGNSKAVFTLFLFHLPYIKRQHHTHSDRATLHTRSPDTLKTWYCPGPLCTFSRT